MKPKIIRIFTDIDMRSQHLGLTNIAANENVDLPNLDQSEFVVFINKRKNKMKIFVHGNTFSYTQRSDIDMRAIKEVPKYFGYGGPVSYDKALETVIRKNLSENRMSQ